VDSVKQHTARKLTRARILLLLDRSQEKRRTDEAIGEVLGCHPKTVANIRRRFLEDGLQATLTDKPMGPTAPRKMTGELEAKLTVLACSDAPEGYAHWTVRLLAEQAVELGYVASLSHVSVGQTLKKRNQTLAGADLVYRQTLGAVRKQAGRRARRLRASLRSQLPGRLLRRDAQGTAWLPPRRSARPTGHAATSGL